jgi:putative transposase
LNYQFWQQDCHAIDLSSEKMWKQRTEYIHLNPVRAGIVEYPHAFVIIKDV